VAEGSVAVEKPKESWWWRINKSASKEEEEAIDLSHDYDGISELDNKLPPWWIAAFAITILFSAGYLWRYHVAHSAPLQDEELAIAITKANAERDAYLAKTASNVDENTVVMLDDGGVAAGKAIYATNCTPCHGQAGEGNTVGPNLTDSYWIHGGGLADVFKSIKYGWVEKGMRSWKDDFSPMQIAQLTSYVKSLAGTNPPNAKEPQGDLYEEKAADVSPNVTDSTKAAPSNR
jgi:cytochrome c oxidase cbb3-type subunit 3